MYESYTQRRFRNGRRKRHGQNSNLGAKGKRAFCFGNWVLKVLEELKEKDGGRWYCMGFSFQSVNQSCCR